MSRDAYNKLQQAARLVAQALPQPALYRAYSAEIRRANETLGTHDLIRRCREHLDASDLECAHGVCHCEAVARDAGALVLIEAVQKGMDAEETEGLFIAAEIAGLLHDIKRREKDHARLGSIEAGRILRTLGIDGRYAGYATDAIKNHEAFKEFHDSSDEAGRLVSDALYDADKFRWGPENFTSTLWLMVEANNTPPHALHGNFREKMKGIEKIKETFRTSTGKKYGPEFIDQGIQIGNVIYDELTAMLSGAS